MQEILPGIYETEKIGEENLDYFLFNVAYPILRKEFGIKKPKKNFHGIKISENADTSAYDKESVSIILHPEMLYADTIGEELTHYLVDSEKGEIGEDVHEFYGMLGRLCLHGKLKNTKYGKLFKENFDKSLSTEGVKGILDLSFNQTDKERDALSILDILDTKVLSLPFPVEYMLEFYRALNKLFYPRSLPETDLLEKFFDKYEQRVKTRIKSFKEKLSEVEKQLESLKYQEEKLKEMKKRRYKPGTIENILHKLTLDVLEAKKEMAYNDAEYMKNTLSSYINCFEEILDEIELTEEEAEKKAEKFVEEHKRIFEGKGVDLNSVIKKFATSFRENSVRRTLEKIQEAYKNNDEEKAEEIISEFREKINKELEVYEEQYNFIQSIKNTYKNLETDLEGLPKITPIDVVASSALNHKAGYDAGLKAYEKIKKGQISYKDIFDMDVKEIKEKFF